MKELNITINIIRVNKSEEEIYAIVEKCIQITQAALMEEKPVKS